MRMLEVITSVKVLDGGGSDEEVGKTLVGEGESVGLAIKEVCEGAGSDVLDGKDVGRALDGEGFCGKKVGLAMNEEPGSDILDEEVRKTLVGEECCEESVGLGTEGMVGDDEGRPHPIESFIGIMSRQESFCLKSIHTALRLVILMPLEAHLLHIVSTVNLST